MQSSELDKMAIQASRELVSLGVTPENYKQLIHKYSAMVYEASSSYDELIFIKNTMVLSFKEKEHNNCVTPPIYSLGGVRVQSTGIEGDTDSDYEIHLPEESNEWTHLKKWEHIFGKISGAYTGKNFERSDMFVWMEASTVDQKYRETQINSCWHHVAPSGDFSVFQISVVPFASAAERKGRSETSPAVSEGWL